MNPSRWLKKMKTEKVSAKPRDVNQHYVNKQQEGFEKVVVFFQHVVCTKEFRTKLPFIITV